VEELARRLRYQAALELTHPGDHILTAHTLNDRIETFLMRLMRGAGIDNLDGLRSERELHGRHLTRPLLGLNHASIVESLKQRGLAWVEDSTNQDEHYDRAFLRHRVILLLEQRNPDFLYTCARTLDNLDDDLGCLDAYGSILFAKSFDKERIELDLSYLEGESAQEWPLLPAVGQRVIYKACQAALVRWAPQARLTKLHVQGLWQNRQENGFSCHLPGGVEARIKAGVLTFKKAKAPRVYPTRREDSQNVTQEGRNR
jgi:tRNA(Ile)-lysidine synthase